MFAVAQQIQKCQQVSKNETLAMIIAEAKERRNGLPEETFMNRITNVNRVVSQKMGHQHGRKGKPNCAESCEILYLSVMVFDLPNPPNIWNQNRRQSQFMETNTFFCIPI